MRLAPSPTPSGLVLEVTDEPDPVDTEVLDERVAACTIGAGGHGEPRPLAVLARDGRGHLTAGVHGWTWGGCCELVSLWVDDGARRRGLAGALLTAAEREASRRACGQVVLLTHAFQAPRLYLRHGYELVATVEGYPAGSAAHWFRKQLAGGTSGGGPPPAAP